MPVFGISATNSQPKPFPVNPVFPVADYQLNALSFNSNVPASASSVAVTPKGSVS